jgi:predicted permease
MANDLRFVLRSLAKSPGFSAAAMLTLALGIGANTAIYSLADATLLRPLKGIEAPEELVTFGWTSSYPDYLEYAKRSDLFRGVIATTGGQRVSLSIDGSADLAQAVFISGNGFDVLGVRPAAGRLLLPSDDLRNGPIAGVLDHEYWRTRFGSNPDIIGKVALVNGRPATVVGVAAAAFRGISLASRPALYLTISAEPQIRTGTGFFSRVDSLGQRGYIWLTVIGRLAPAVAAERAAGVIDTIYTQFHPPEGGDRTERMQLTPSATTALGRTDAASVQRFVVLLVGVVGLTLLIGCANLANLLLARSARRSRDIGVRLALGAGRGRIVRQVLFESVMLALLGGTAGLLVASVGLDLLGAFQLPGAVDIETLDLEVNRSALAAAAALSLFTGLLVGAVPAWRASAADVLIALGDDARIGTTRSGLRSGLVAAQVALSLVLLTGSGLFLRSLVRALEAPLGFDVSNVATVSINLGLARYDDPRAQVFYDLALERVRQVPGVTAASWSWSIPTNGVAIGEVEVEGYQARGTDSSRVHWSYAGPDYFRAAGTRILAGRSFSNADTPAAVPVAIVSEALAGKYFAGREAIGGRIRLFDQWVTVVGVAENTIVERLGERPVPYLYLAFNQWLSGKYSIATDPANLFIRVSGNQTTILPIVRDRIRSIDPAVALYNVRQLAFHVRELAMPQRMGVTLLGFCSLLAVSLALVGIYGVASYMAAMRSREIGVRMALGAQAADIGGLILRRGVTPVASGVIVGLLLAFWASRLAETFLYQVEPFDPLTFGLCGALLGAVSLFAAYLPARRAARLDPVTALRHD